jgi:hypothetical protein
MSDQPVTIGRCVPLSECAKSSVKLYGTSPNNWHSAEDVQRRLAKLEAVAEAARNVMWVFDCHCDEAYTGRGMHEPNAICDEGDDLRAALATLDALEGKE